MNEQTNQPDASEPAPSTPPTTDTNLGGNAMGQPIVSEDAGPLKGDEPSEATNQPDASEPAPSTPPTSDTNPGGNAMGQPIVSEDAGDQSDAAANDSGAENITPEGITPPVTDEQPPTTPPAPAA